MKIRMRSWISGTLILILVLSSGFLVVVNQVDDDQQWSTTIKPNAINAVIGDESYRAKYGAEPDKRTFENERITTHLQYVQQKLLDRNVDFLSQQQQENRTKYLNRLTDYIRQGEFPQNNAFPNQHRPNFIDSEGRICAVGYLIEQSMGHEVAESINDKYQYEYVLKMDSNVLEKWAQRNGFTVRELAMIQPAYDDRDPCCVIGPEPNQDKISRPLESVMIGASVGLSVINGYLNFENSSKVIPAAAGIVVGASSITLGLTEKLHYSTTDYITGGLSVAAGSWALHSIFKNNSSSNNLTIAPVPNTRFDGKVGLSVNYRF